MECVIRLRRRTHGIKRDVGGISSRARPDPIPNSEVKTAWANDSHTHVCAKVGGCPTMLSSVLKDGAFLILMELIINSSAKRRFSD